MIVLIFFTIVIIIFILFLIYYSHFSQVIIHKKNKKEFIQRLKNKVKGIQISKGYFAISHKIITENEFKLLTRTQKLKYSSCYNIIIFKTEHAHWELFFHLIKDGTFYSQILNLRVFPIKNHIKTEGNIEKNYTRLNIFTNSRYLSAILESSELTPLLKWLIKNNGDILLVNHTNLHFKAFLNSTTNLNIDDGMNMIKTMNEIRNKIYKKGILEY